MAEDGSQIRILLYGSKVRLQKRLIEFNRREVELEGVPIEGHTLVQVVIRWLWDSLVTLNL